jgi:hypothetical protein
VFHQTRVPGVYEVSRLGICILNIHSRRDPILYMEVPKTVKGEMEMSSPYNPDEVSMETFVFIVFVFLLCVFFLGILYAWITGTRGWVYP